MLFKNHYKSICRQLKIWFSIKISEKFELNKICRRIAILSRRKSMNNESWMILWISSISTNFENMKLFARREIIKKMLYKIRKVNLCSDRSENDRRWASWNVCIWIIDNIYYIEEFNRETIRNISRHTIDKSAFIPVGAIISLIVFICFLFSSDHSFLRILEMLYMHNISFLYLFLINSHKNEFRVII
jgi:hypothetical protein